MTQPEWTDVLNRLLAMLYRSLPLYLQGTQPWMRPGDEKAWEALVRMAADHKHYASKLAELIQESGGLVDPGQFPLAFTGLHDVALDYLIRRVIELQKRDLCRIEQCVAELKGHPRARAVAEEILGNARGHLEILEELSVRTPS
jgi:hypothetical protein